MLLSTGLTFAYFNYLQPPTGAARAIVCVDRDTGQIIWQRTAFWAPADRKHSWSSHATPTPVTNGRYIVASFGPGIACADMDGNLIWTKREPR
jgi:outer membrane protein assembly factor BamB